MQIAVEEIVRVEGPNRKMGGGKGPKTRKLSGARGKWAKKRSPRNRRSKSKKGGGMGRKGGVCKITHTNVV